MSGHKFEITRPITDQGFAPDWHGADGIITTDLTADELREIANMIDNDDTKPDQYTTVLQVLPLLRIRQQLNDLDDVEVGDADTAQQVGLAAATILGVIDRSASADQGPNEWQEQVETAVQEINDALNVD